MPHWFITEKVKLPPDADRRRRLTEEQRREIKDSPLPIRQLARIYEVSRSTVKFIKFPEKLEHNKMLRKQRGGSKIYYDRKKNTEAKRKHLRYKASVLGLRKKTHQPLENNSTTPLTA